MKITEKNFIEQLKRKNEKALDYLIDQYGWIVKTVVSKHLFALHDHQEECINDILLAVWQNIDKYDTHKGSFKNWIAGVSRFKALDFKRRYLQIHQREVQEEMEISWEDPGIQNLLEDELSRELQEMMACLKETDRELFQKLFVEEKDMHTVSEETGMKPDLIYNRVSRARKKIRTKFPGKNKE